MWLTAFLWAASFVIQSILRPKQERVQPAGLSDFQVPSIEEGRILPVLWGTGDLAPLVAWYGDLDSIPIQLHGISGFFNDSVLAWKYRLGMEIWYCSGQVDSILGVYFDNKFCAADIINTFSDHYEFHLQDDWLFGGDLEGGGVQGWFYVYKGTATQTADSYLQTAKNAGNPIPANRRICYGVCRPTYLGTSKYIKVPRIRAKRCPNPLNLTGGAHDIGGDANAANMIFSLMTSAHEDNGEGIPSGLIDTTAFAAVGQTLATEGLGLSMVVDRASDTVIEEILRHIDGRIYLEPSTGLLTLKLNRPDYDPATIPVFNTDNCTVTAFSRPGWRELINKVIVSYIDRADNFKRKTTQADNLAAMDIRGGEVVPEEIAFLGFSNATNAQTAASRALVSLSYELAVGTMESDRSAWSLRPGSPFRLDNAPDGTAGLICRVTKIRGGTILDGKITVDFVEDVFGLNLAIYSPPPATSWVNPADAVPSLLTQVAINAPYESVKTLSPGPDSQARALTFAQKGTGVVSGYDLYVRRQDSTWPPATEVLTLTPTTVLNSSLSITGTTIVLTQNADTDLLETLSDADFSAGKSLLWLDDEFIAFGTVTQGAGTVTLGGCVRGLLDTVPQVHSSGKRVWLISKGMHIQDINTPVTSLTETLRFQAFNSKTEVPFASAPDVSFTCSKPVRAALPLAQTKVLIVGVSYPTAIGAGTTLALSWQHRNRLASWNYGNGGTTPTQETGVTYTVKIYGDGGTLKHTETGITTDNYTYPQATETAENGGILNSSLRVQIFAVRGTDQSWQMFDYSFVR